MLAMSIPSNVAMSAPLSSFPIHVFSDLVMKGVDTGLNTVDIGRTAENAAMPRLLKIAPHPWLEPKGCGFVGCALTFGARFTLSGKLRITRIYTHGQIPRGRVDLN